MLIPEPEKLHFKRIRLSSFKKKKDPDLVGLEYSPGMKMFKFSQVILMGGQGREPLSSKDLTFSFFFRVGIVRQWPVG